MRLNNNIQIYVAVFAMLALCLSCSKPSKTIVYTADVEPIKSASAALPGVFIQPFIHCQAAIDAVPGNSADGQVCTPVAISGSTEAARYYPDYGDCGVVRSQRPYWPAPPAGLPDPNDPRLQDPAYIEELNWVPEQAYASACVCCHDSRVAPNGPSQWYIDAEFNWLTTASNNAIALFSGHADSQLLGAYHPDVANGFAREISGLPSTDSLRMRAFMEAELTHREITIQAAQAVTPFGGPLYTFSIETPPSCAAGQGVLAQNGGIVIWSGGPARYIYIMEEQATNPGVPPNLDLPTGTIWRIDVPANRDGIPSGVSYGTTPFGTTQTYPADKPAAALRRGVNYHMTVLYDVGVPLVNCVFQYGTVVRGATQPTNLFGGFCTESANCLSPVDTCFKAPWDAFGYCSVAGCDIDPTICPAGWSCWTNTFDTSAAAVCERPY